MCVYFFSSSVVRGEGLWVSDFAMGPYKAHRAGPNIVIGYHEKNAEHGEEAWRLFRDLFEFKAFSSSILYQEAPLPV